MFKNRYNNLNNISGDAIRKLRLQQEPRMSQRALAQRLQLSGIDLDKNAIQRIECGKRFVTDIELRAFAHVLHVTVEQLLSL